MEGKMRKTAKRHSHFQQFLLLQPDKKAIYKGKLIIYKKKLS